MNIKKTYSLPYADTEADKIYSNYDYVYQKEVGSVKHWFINDYDTEVVVGSEPNQIPENTDFHFTTQVKASNINEVAHILSQRIHNIGQDLSYWDVYHIRASVETSDELNAQFAMLAPGESLVVNVSDTIIYDNNRLNRGDVIVKTLDGQALVVKALTQGVYYPAAISHDAGNNRYTIHYKYSNQMPTDNTSSEIQVQETETPEYLGSPAAQIDLIGFQDTVKQQPYNERYDSLSATFSIPAILLQEDTPLAPVIKFFMNTTNEEVYVDYTLSYSPTEHTYTITINDLDIINYIYCQIK